ncbi:MAG: S-methyl-5-thioribose-1-phosphate isomerase [Bacteriovoracaceae bacterium]|nr:S-methyl-5-thioribose-1-phosphate isomerase [Bacteriovoracaceae bacterium]
MNIDYVSLKWNSEGLSFLDQRKLPLEEVYVKAESIEDAWGAIHEMVVRGAPLIGFTAISGLALELLSNRINNLDDFKQKCDYLKTARPTAVNLMFEIDESFNEVKRHIESNESWEDAGLLLKTRLNNQMKKLEEDNLIMAKLAEKKLSKLYGDKKLNILTLCNTGFLACGTMGTALGAISYLNSLGRIEKVYASETRPYMQGIRLTSWELQKENINHDIIVEGATSHLMKTKKIDAVFIGADRIVGNGDTANKIGSSGLSILCDFYNVPFFVVAPISSFDLSLDNGNEINIEMRSEDEILSCRGQRLAPAGASAYNPSFDISDHSLITSIFCEKGEIHPVNKENVLRITGE